MFRWTGLQTAPRCFIGNPITRIRSAVTGFIHLPQTRSHTGSLKTYRAIFEMRASRRMGNGLLSVRTKPDVRRYTLRHLELRAERSKSRPKAAKMYAGCR